MAISSGTMAGQGCPSRGLGRLLLLAALSAGCATLPPLRAADPLQATAQGEEARAELAGVRLLARADGWRSWPERYAHLLTAVEVRLANAGPVPLRLRPAQFALERDGQPPLQALQAGDLPRVLVFQGPVDPDLRWWAGTPSQSPTSPTVYPYAWSGLTRAGDLSRPEPGHGPDPRPYPQGVMAVGQEATFMVFFEVPAAGLQRFTLAAALVAEDGALLGTVRLPFQRAAVP